LHLHAVFLGLARKILPQKALLEVLQIPQEQTLFLPTERWIEIRSDIS